MAVLSGYLAGARLRRAAPYIRGDVLDLGCAGARILTEFGDRISSYTGIDHDDASITELRQAYPESTFLARNLDDDPLELNRQFDCVAMLAIVEHLFNQKHVFSQVKRLLKPDGRVVITTPTPLGNDVVHRLGARVGLFAGSAADDHIVIYNRHRFTILAEEVGLTLEKYESFQLGCNQFAVLANPA